MIDDIKNFLPLGPGVEVVKFDPKTTLIALKKPVGIMSHPNDGRVNKNSLILAPYKITKKHFDLKSYYHSTAVMQYHTSTVEQKMANWVEKYPCAYLLNRLDSPTSGLIILTLDPKIAKEVKELFRLEKVNKKYHAQVMGKPKSEQWVDKLEVINKGGKLRTKVSSRGQIAKTSVKLLKYDPKTNISEVELIPHTGRTHQLRVQCAHHGHPILGDKTYGDFAFNKESKTSRMLLNSSEIEIKLSGDRSFNAKIKDYFS